MNLEDAFLNQMRIQKIGIYIQFQGSDTSECFGFIRGFDDKVIVLDCTNEDGSASVRIIYKNAIKYILPTINLDLFTRRDGNTGDDEDDYDSFMGETYAYSDDE